MADEGEDDATEILARDASVAAATELDATLPHTRAKLLTEPTATQLLPTQKRKWPSSALIAIATLSGMLLVLVVYYFLAPQPPAPSPEPARVDAYQSALAIAGSAIRNSEMETLPALLLGHSREQPDNAEVRNLLQDATRYRDLLYLLQRSRLMDTAAERRAHVFHSSLLEEAARQNIDNTLPPADLIRQLTDARYAWRGGDLVTAITSVKKLAAATNHQEARGMLQHYSRVVQDYETLAVLVDSSEYPQKLLSFYLQLDPLEDHFFWERLEKDSQRATAQPAAALSKQLQDAAHLWSRYHSQGGIDGEMRQAPMAGNAFAQRAAELSQVSEQLGQVASGLHRPQQAGGPPWHFPALLEEEIAVQRDRLQTLLRFNEEAILKDRLDMLPRPAATSRLQ